MPLAASAQDLFTGSEATGAGEGVIEEIVVTTRKREENLQEVPMSIGVFSSDDIMRVGIRDLEDVTKLSPSVQFSQGWDANAIRVTIRGITNTRGRSNVAFLVDGIDVTSETTGTNAGSPLLLNQRLLADVERIEVVRGPQSALYGRSAFAGAINYVSKKPDDEFNFNISAEGGNATELDSGSRYEILGGFTGPITDTLGFRVSAVAWEDDGIYPNVISGNGFSGGEGSGISGALRWEPSDNFDLTTRVTYSDDEYTPTAVAHNDGRDIIVAVPQEAIDQGVTDETSVELMPMVGNADGLEVRASEDPQTGGDYPGNTLEVLRASLIANWVIGDYTLSSYTGYTDADMTQRYDFDRQAEGRPDTLLGHGDIDTYGETEQFSQELRLASSWDFPIQATVGLQYWQETRDDFSRSVSVTCWNTNFCGPNQTIPNPSPFITWQDLYAAVGENAPGFRSEINAEVDHRSAYAMLEWSMTDSLALIIEDRFVKEELNGVLPRWSSCNNNFAYNAELEFYQFSTGLRGPTCAQGAIEPDSVSSDYQTPKVTLEWQTTDQAMLYGLIAKGVKPAGFSLVRVPVKIAALDAEWYRFDEEKLWSYEIGAKTQWGGRAGELLFNTAVFYQDYTDKQTNTQQQVGNQIIGKPTNADGAEVTGIEIETNWFTPIKGLSLGVGYTWLDAEYDKFLDSTRAPGRIAIAGNCDQLDPNLSDPFCLLDLSGNKLEMTPEHAAVITGHYGNNLGSSEIEWFIESNASYQSERYTSADNYTKLDDFWLVDPRVGLSNEQWSLIGFVDNVFDDNTIQSAGSNVDVAAGYVDSGDLVPPGLSTAFMPAPRTVGVRIQYQYR
ncbi:MAG: TonB-dependent receptor [Gammaproteobacteria bacterium]